MYFPAYVSFCFVFYEDVRDFFAFSGSEHDLLSPNHAQSPSLVQRFQEQEDFKEIEGIKNKNISFETRKINFFLF